jgi:hypothetical protein
MLGILLIYFIGKAFYDLALKYDKNKWVFAILGVVIYYGGTFLGGVLLGLAHVYGWININNTSDIVLGLMAIPFGLIIMIVFFQILKSNWKKQAELTSHESEVLDEDLIG